MNLVIDIGNTRAKVGVFQKNTLLKTLVCQKENLIEEKNKLLKVFPEINHGIVANVAKPEKGYKGALKYLNGTTLELHASTPVPFINRYKTPHSLGLDRIALAASAATQFPNQNTLVIDSGTCVTYDLISSENEYLGGAISNGLNMRFRALNHFTANLPLLQAKNMDSVEIGRNTEESIQLGVKQGLLYEMDGFIDRYKHLYPNLNCVLTGGDCEILSKRLKNSIFAIKNFLLSGLNCILEFNKD